MSVAQLFKDIADAIREKTGSEDLITPLQMPDAIRAIETGGSMHNYSTEEQQIGTWINGKPLYEIVVKNVNHATVLDLSYLNIETIIYMEALGCNTSAGFVDGDPVAYNIWTLNGLSGDNGRGHYINPSKQYIRNGGEVTGNIIIRYTKSTDTV